MSINNKGYVVILNQLYEYNPASNQWTQKANAPVSFSNWCIAFSIGASGYVKNGNGLYEYKPLNNQWVARAGFPGANTNGGAAMIHNNRAYVVSGYVGSLSFLTDEVWEYNPGNNVWTRMADFPGSARRFSVAFTINNRGYFGTGTHGINLNDFWEMQTTVSVEENNASFGMNVYPNPAQDHVTFEITRPGQTDQLTLRVTDLAGKLIHEEVFSNGRIILNRDELQSGVYLYTVTDGNASVSNGKFIFN
jgi:N-acetylneuraminic acid mutarotase